MSIHWLSFADDKGFLGAILIEAPDFIVAIRLAHAMKINPGGQVLGAELPETVKVGTHIHESWMNVLLNKEEATALDSQDKLLTPRIPITIH